MKILLTFIFLATLTFGCCPPICPLKSSTPDNGYGEATNRSFKVKNLFPFIITIYESGYQTCRPGRQITILNNGQEILLNIPQGETKNYTVTGYGVVCVDVFNKPTCGSFKLMGFKNFNNGFDEFQINATTVCQ
jgi:hypothetical protein